VQKQFGVSNDSTIFSRNLGNSLEFYLIKQLIWEPQQAINLLLMVLIE